MIEQLTVTVFFKNLFVSKIFGRRQGYIRSGLCTRVYTRGVIHRGYTHTQRGLKHAEFLQWGLQKNAGIFFKKTL